jgi:hypothetical protein
MILLTIGQRYGTQEVVCLLFGACKIKHHGLYGVEQFLQKR